MIINIFTEKEHCVLIAVRILGVRTAEINMVYTP